MHLRSCSEVQVTLSDVRHTRDGVYRECSFCLMDTSDPYITFDDAGRCHHCRRVEEVHGKVWFADESGGERLQRTVERIRDEGKGKPYDCVLGLSGGVDSSYLALKAHDWGLRPLVVHIDAGWNSELAVQNIQRILDSLDYELHTTVINWADMRELHLSYLRAAVPNQDVPQDHAFMANLYHFAVENKVRYVLNGGNVASEGIFPDAWHGPAMDAINIRAIHGRFGTQQLEDYRLVSFWQYYYYYPIVRRMRPIRLLNLYPFNKQDAITELSERVGWRTYPRKHGESLFTKYFQNYYLPEKFGMDKRRPHLSSLIASGQLTRAEARAQLDAPLYEPEELRRDQEYVARKLRIQPGEFESLLAAPPHVHTDFDNWSSRYNALKRVQSGLQRVTGHRVGAYS